jgi:hypothetical protein
MSRFSGSTDAVVTCSVPPPPFFSTAVAVTGGQKMTSPSSLPVPLTCGGG